MDEPVSVASRLQIIGAMGVKTSRPFTERFLDGYDRHELRREVAKTKPRRLSGLRKKYATWAIGGALAVGGMGIPLKVGKMLTATEASQRAPEPETSPEKTTTRQIAADMSAAQKITTEVSSGVTSAAADVAQTV